jgi:hypothetical protein
VPLKLAWKNILMMVANNSWMVLHRTVVGFNFLEYFLVSCADVCKVCIYIVVDHIDVQLSVRLVGTSSFLTTTFTFYDCNIHTTLVFYLAIALYQCSVAAKYSVAHVIAPSVLNMLVRTVFII